MELTLPLIATLLGYLIGSISFAVVVSRLMGLDDPRAYGSGNPGATNVLRSGNKKAAILTLLMDALKGFVPVWLVVAFGEPYGLGEGTAALVGLAAFVGHLWPVFFGFKGGKGVATAAGVLFGVHWLLGLACMGTWVLVAYVSRYSSLSALSCAMLAPLYYVMGDRGLWYVDRSVLLMLVLMGALLIYRHRENISKLLQGKESKLGAKPKS
jgi:glycerol-3-phosphate acyltransferase PlsY